MSEPRGEPSPHGSRLQNQAHKNKNGGRTVVKRKPTVAETRMPHNENEERETQARVAGRRVHGMLRGVQVEKNVHQNAVVAGSRIQCVQVKRSGGGAEKNRGSQQQQKSPPSSVKGNGGRVAELVCWRVAAGVAQRWENGRAGVIAGIAETFHVIHMHRRIPGSWMSVPGRW